MRRIFDNGTTRARAQAWGLWLLFGAVWAGVAFWTPAPSPGRWPCLLSTLGLASWLILVRKRPLTVPVLNYHSVSAHPEWMQIGHHVSLTPAAFERQLAYLRKRDYQSLFISEVHAMLGGKTRRNPTRPYVALTFDDGYADNWVAVFPLLRKYDMKATLFVSTDFVADADRCRDTVEGKSRAEWDGLDWEGYLTWPELNEMRASGLVEIQSHGSSHTRVFAGSELRGFVGPGKPNPWLLWNAHPETRTSWWREGETERSLWGHPVFRQAPALAHRVWIPDSEAVTRLLAWSTTQGATLFGRPDWEQRLIAAWQNEAKEHDLHGDWESVEGYERRVESDIRGARQVIEEKLGARTSVLCWPENAFSPAGEAIAHRVGYTATVSNRHDSRNAVGEAADRIVRVFIGSHAAGIRCQWLDFAAFVLELKVFEGWYVWYPLLAVMHRSRKAAFAVRRRWRCRKDYWSVWG